MCRLPQEWRRGLPGFPASSQETVPQQVVCTKASVELAPHFPSPGTTSVLVHRELLPSTGQSEIYFPQVNRSSVRVGRVQEASRSWSSRCSHGKTEAREEKDII